MAEWFERFFAYALQLFVCFCQFDSFRVDGGALCLVACRTILVAFVSGCLGHRLLVVRIVVCAVATVE